MRDILYSRKWNSKEISIQRCDDYSYEHLDKINVQTLFLFGYAFMDEGGDIVVEFGRDRRKCILAGMINSTFFTNPEYVLFSPVYFNDNVFLIDYPVFIFHSLFIATKQYQIKPSISSSYILSVLRAEKLLFRHCPFFLMHTYS